MHLSRTFNPWVSAVQLFSTRTLFISQVFHCMIKPTLTHTTKTWKNHTTRLNTWYCSLFLLFCSYQWRQISINSDSVKKTTFAINAEMCLRCTIANILLLLFIIYLFSNSHVVIMQLQKVFDCMITVCVYTCMRTVWDSSFFLIWRRRKKNCDTRLNIIILMNGRIYCLDVITRCT